MLVYLVCMLVGLVVSGVEVDWWSGGVYGLIVEL
jgi:hypothetical protein